MRKSIKSTPGFKRKQDDVEHIKVRIDESAKLYMIQYQHLQKCQEIKLTKFLLNSLIMFEPFFEIALLFFS